MVNNENNIDKNNNNMSSFEETIARMKGLYTYGKELNEDNNLRTHTLEYHAIGADGKSYGIIKECNKYYIKTAPQSKEMVAEAYDYIGGFCNKSNYEYKSYANALKNFELKLASINEAYDGDVNIATLDPFKKEEYIVEGTRKMQDEIARCRQIMYNASMIMNESTNFTPVKGDGAKNNANQPEAENGKTGAEGYKKATANGDKDFTKKTNGLQPSQEPFTQKAPKTSGQLGENKCCEKCGKDSKHCTCCNEEAGDIGDNPLMPNTENWGTEGIGKGRDPKQVGWEIEGQKNVNEDTDEWDEGLPNSAGIGDADTGHNNNPFNKSINEEDEEDFNDTESDTFDDGNEDMSTDTDFDAGLDDEYSDDETGDEFDDETGDEFNDEEDDEFNDETSGDFSDDEFDGEGEEGEEEDIQSQIDSLKAQIEELEAKLNGEDSFEDDEFDNEESDDFSDDEFDDEGDDFSNDEFDDEENDDFSDENEIDECGLGGKPMAQNQMMETKRRKMNKIIESVTRRILKEDELHDFGKHPGYRKKPMELPSTGEDKNQWGRDWNDESVHSEEPFGSKIGNGDPFNQLVNAITKDVMYQLKKGIPIEGENKKKES